MRQIVACDSTNYDHLNSGSGTQSVEWCEINPTELSHSTLDPGFHQAPTALRRDDGLRCRCEWSRYWNWNWKWNWPVTMTVLTRASRSRLMTAVVSGFRRFSNTISPMNVSWRSISSLDRIYQRNKWIVDPKINMLCVRNNYIVYRTCKITKLRSRI